jgi:hypothetical protein
MNAVSLSLGYTADRPRYDGSAKFLDLSEQASKFNTAHSPLTIVAGGFKL